MRVLGLDASSKTIGWSILDFDEITNSIKLIKADFFKPPKDGNLFERLKEIQDFIINILETYEPDAIAIEEIAKFMSGLSTAKTIIMLATVNRTVGLTCFNFNEKPPELYNVLAIRHGLKLNKVLPKKEDMPALVAKHLSIKFPFVYKTGKNKITKKIEENQDVADSIAVALYHIFLISKQLYKDKK